MDPIKKSKYLGAVDNVELGKAVCDFINDLKPEIFLGCSCFGYTEDLPGAILDKFYIDKDNWISIISFIDLKEDKILYRLTVFVLEKDYGEKYDN